MNRPTARQAKESKWLKMRSKRERADWVINHNVVKALVGFKEYSDMRKLLCEVLSFTLLPEQIQVSESFAFLLLSCIVHSQPHRQ